MRVVSIASGKGGVGKTTLAAGLASVLAGKFSKKTLVIDCNMTTSHLGLYTGLEDTPYTLNHVLTKRVHVSDVIYRHHSGFEIIPASIRMRDLHGVDAFEIYNLVKRDNSDVFSKYDIILLDCAPGLGREAMAGIRVSDESILVATPYLPAVMDAIKCNEILREMNIKPLGLVINMVRKHKHELKPDYIKNLTNMHLISSIPADAEVLSSLAKRMPVTIYSPKSKASKMIHAVADHVVKEGGR